jgi:hypothetical protein
LGVPRFGWKRFGRGWGSCAGRRAAGLWLIIAAFLPVSGQAEKIRGVDARNVAVAIYSDDSSTQVAVLKVGKVFIESRRLGFFRVKLLPMIVAQGVHLEFTESAPSTNWPSGFRANPAPLAPPGTSVEWRDFSVRFAQDARPRLRAARLHPPTKTDTESCLLEDATLQTDAGALNVSRATLLLKGLTGRVVWESQGAVQQWDLFTRTLISDKSKN